MGLFQRQRLGSEVHLGMPGLALGSSESLQVSKSPVWGCGWSGSLGIGVSPVGHPRVSAAAQVAERAGGGGGSQG